MNAVRIAIGVALVTGCDSGRPPAPPPSPTSVPQADARVADMAIDADLSYPKAWIDAAVADNHDHACQHLIYKHGCRELRTGFVELDVTLDDQGKAATVRARSTKISNDEELVEKCLLRAVPKWRFHPPDGRAHDLVLTVHFADKC